MNQPQYEVPLDRTANVPISEGVHVFTVKDAEETESSKGNPMWVFTLACQTPTEEGKEARLYLTLTQNTRWKLELFLDAMRAPATGSVTADKFVGRQMRAQITHEDFEGRPQARVGEMYPLSQVGAAPKPQGVVINKTSAAAVPASPTVTKKVVAKKASALPTDAVPTEKEIPF
jgi:hypothetical protein